MRPQAGDLVVEILLLGVELHRLRGTWDSGHGIDTVQIKQAMGTQCELGAVLCGSSSRGPCGSVAVWLCGGVAVWRVAAWQCGSVAVCSVVVWQ